MSKLQEIAVLRPEETSAVATIRAAELAEQLLSDDGARRVGRGAHGVAVAIDVGEGRNVLVSLEPREIRLDAMLYDEVFYDEEHGTEEDDPSVNDEVLDVADAIVRRLQAATDWSVESEHLLGFERLSCPGCEGACFEWQERCSGCGRWLDSDGDEPSGPAPPDEDDEWAEAIIEGLLRQRLLELVSSSARASVESRLAAHLGFLGPTPGSVLRLLVDADGVDEIFADEDDLARILDETARR